MGALRIVSAGLAVAGALVLVVARPGGWATAVVVIALVGMLAALVGSVVGAVSRARVRNGGRCDCGGRLRLAESYLTVAGTGQHLTRAYRCTRCRTVRRVRQQ